MKRYLIYIGFCLFTFIFACNTKRDRIEEGAYNPYDTSEEMDKYDAEADTLYSTDSIAANLRLYEPGTQPPE